MATITIENSPSTLDMRTVKAKLASYGSLAKSCRFAVRILPKSFANPLLNYYNTVFNDLTYLCEVAEFPGRGFISIDNIRYYGPSFKAPVQSSYEDITLTFLCRQQGLERQLFDDWMDMINPVNNFDFNYKDDYACKIDIFQFSDYDTTGRGSPDPIYLFSLQDAWPILVNPQPVTWADDQFLRLGVTFTYFKWTRGALDPTPSTNTDGSWSFIPTDIET